MNNFLPWIRILLATSIFCVAAITAAIAVRRSGRHMKEMKDRTSRRILVIGAIANICVLVVTVLLLKYLDNRSLTDLGLRFSENDFDFSILGMTIIFTLAVVFAVSLSHFNRFRIRLQKPVRDRTDISGLGGGILTLFIVALQEEVLFRGYITLNLLSFGPAVVIFVSTILFAAIHLLTNRANIYQFASWLLTGAVLAYIYLVCGSIWVPVILHFAIDLTNMLILNIAGRFSFFKIVPPVTDRQRSAYRLVCNAALVVVLLAFYSTQIRFIL